MGLEQAEVLDTGITQEPVQIATDQDREITAILDNALKESQGTPEVHPETGESTKEGQSRETETPFLELVIGADKIPLKSEEEWINFLEANPTLKEGWLKNADYTRKTMALAEDRKTFDQQLKEFKQDQESWGEVKPDTNSMNAFKIIWNVYQRTEPIVQDAIQKFVQDVTLIGNGQMPVGPLAQMLNVSSSTKSSSELLPLQKEIAILKQELNQFRGQTEAEKKQAQERFENDQRIQGEQIVGKWIDEKAKGGISIAGDELLAMADFMGIFNSETGQPKYSLDQAYTLALSSLGKSKAAITKEVIKDAKLLNKKTPIMPSSKASSSEEPEPKTIKDILMQNVKSLASV